MRIRPASSEGAKQHDHDRFGPPRLKRLRLSGPRNYWKNLATLCLPFQDPSCAGSAELGGCSAISSRDRGPGSRGRIWVIPR